MVTRQTSAENSESSVPEALRALFSRNPAFHGTLEFLFRNAAESLSFQDLRSQPHLAVHRNLIGPEPFLLPGERFGGSQDVALLPLIRDAVDETLRAYAYASPHLLQHVGKTPISPYGSMGLSVSRWGHVDWDYVRDLDWRVFLPPEIGHLSGFKSNLEQNLTGELHKYKLYRLLGGKDAQGRPQVQLRDAVTSEVHGFHFFLIAMKPRFVRGNLHRDGGYSPHFAYFPEGSLDEHLKAGDLAWSDVIAQLREDYIEMFNQLSFNIFGENTGEDRLFKTRDWYLHKAFKWYATLARSRGLSALEEDLLYQYEHFRGSEAELSYLARYRYYARMAPSRPRLDDVDRDLARTASIAYARARNLEDPLIGRHIGLDSGDIILLELVSQSFRAEAAKLLKEVESTSPCKLSYASVTGTARYADNLLAPCIAELEGCARAVLIPAEWSLVFCDSYACQVAKRAAEEKTSIVEQDIRQALVLVLASLLARASQLSNDSGGPVPG